MDPHRVVAHALNASVAGAAASGAAPSAVSAFGSRRSAIDKARQRANMYAETLGTRVRRIVSISEGGSVGPPMPMMAMARMEKYSDTPISPGENVLSVSLDVVFELEP